MQASHHFSTKIIDFNLFILLTLPRRIIDFNLFILLTLPRSHIFQYTKKSPPVIDQRGMCITLFFRRYLLNSSCQFRVKA